MEAHERQQGIVIACSALKRVYRDRLRGGTGHKARFAFLDASFEVIDARLKKRIHHFMPESLLRSQFATLERPTPDETDVIIVDVDQSPEAVAEGIADRLATTRPTAP